MRLRSHLIARGAGPGRRHPRRRRRARARLRVRAGSVGGAAHLASRRAGLGHRDARWGRLHAGGRWPPATTCTCPSPWIPASSRPSSRAWRSGGPRP